MNETQFYDWLCIKFSGGTPRSRLSNCLRVEQYEGNLDDHYARDRGKSLLNKLSYSMDDKRNGRVPKHNIPIDGNIYTGSATLKQAVNLYFQFKAGDIPENTNKRRALPIKIRRKQNRDWPHWDTPTDEELYELIKLTAKYAKFLHPEIVQKIVEDNNYHKEVWSAQLARHNVSPSIYFWENSPCAFPGVRRYSGSKEIAYFRKHAELSDHEIHHAVVLDDNDFPKQIWSYIFRQNKFQKYGPKNYALAHLADHKEYNNRLFAEFDIESKSEEHQLFGLFTCPSNTVYIPTSLIRPTDFSPAIRKLLISRAHDLYGSFANILPPWIKLNPKIKIPWKLAHFQWADPVGLPGNVEPFLKFRKETMKAILT